MGEPQLGVGVGGALRQRLAVRRCGTVEVAGLDGVEGLLVQGRQGLLLLDLVGGGSDVAGRDGARDAVLRRERQHLVDDRRDLGLGLDTLEERHRTNAMLTGTACTWKACRIVGLASTSTVTSWKRPA